MAAIKTTSKDKNLSRQYIITSSYLNNRKALIKLHAFRNSQINVILERNLLSIMLFLVRGRGVEIEKNEKTDKKNIQK